MDIAVNSEVYCTDGFYGHSICTVLNPETDQVTHVAVQQLFSRPRLVPITHIVNSTPDRIQLDLSKKEIGRGMPPFIKTEFLESDLPDILYTTDLMWPHFIADLEMKTIEHENIPLGELGIHSGVVVKARDGAIGHLEDLIVNPDDKNVTQIVVRGGHWFSHSRLAIPVSAIDRFEDDVIHLSLSKRETEALRTA